MKPIQPESSYPPPLRSMTGNKRGRQKSDGRTAVISNPPKLVSSLSSSTTTTTPDAIPSAAAVGGGTALLSDGILPPVSSVARNGKKSTHHSLINGQKIPEFLTKLYEMINNCDPAIASWTENNDMFIVHDPDRLAKLIIPQYFEHSKFSSFARQLNFYGFRKVQCKPVVRQTNDKQQPQQVPANGNNKSPSSSKEVMFHHEYFKKNRFDLLSKIRRSTRGGGAHPTGGADPKGKEEVDELKRKVIELERRIEGMSQTFERRLVEVNREFERRVEEISKERSEVGRGYLCSGCRKGRRRGDDDDDTARDLYLIDETTPPLHEDAASTEEEDSGDGVEVNGDGEQQQQQAGGSWDAEPLDEIDPFPVNSSVDACCEGATNVAGDEDGAGAAQLMAFADLYLGNQEDALQQHQQLLHSEALTKMQTQL